MRTYVGSFFLKKLIYYLFLMIIRRNRTKLTWRVVVLSFICGLTGWVSPAFPLTDRYSLSLLVALVWQAAAKPLLYYILFLSGEIKQS